MESWLPAVGSRLAVTGKDRATLDRGFWLSRFAGAVLHRTVDRFGVAQHPGLREVRHSFVSVEDVAKVVFRLAGSTQRLPEEFQVGGQPRSWAEVIDEHSAALGRPLRTLRVPVGPFRAVAALLRPFSPTAANLLRVQGLVGTKSTIVDPSAAEVLLGRQLLPVSAISLKPCVVLPTRNKLALRRDRKSADPRVLDLTEHPLPWTVGPAPGH